MPIRIAGSMSLIVFAVCLLMGIAAENSFVTTVIRALQAMAVTMVVGLVVGAMAQRMLDENGAVHKKLEVSETKPAAKDR